MSGLPTGEPAPIGSATEEAAARQRPPAAPWSRLLAMGLTVCAVGLAWAGQALTTRTLPDALSALDVLARAFWVYPNKREISAAFIMLVAGALVLGITAFRCNGTEDDEPMLGATRPFRFETRRDVLMLGGAAAGVLLWAVFLWRLYGGHYQHRLNFVLLAALVLLAIPLVKRDFIDRHVRLYYNRAWPLHLAFGVVVTGAFIYLNARDLRSWKYSAVGDEYANFNYALRIAKGYLDVNPWSHRGADDLMSVAGSMGQALFMKLGNEDNFAWKLFSVFAGATAFIPFYFLIRELFRTRVAVVATALFASSHYIFGYAHHYVALDAMLPTMLGLWLLVVGLRRDSALALFASGLALAGGFYTWESGRAAVAVVAVFMLTFGVRSFRPAVFVPLAGGFILLALPLFATDGPYHVLDQMFGQSAIGYSSEVTGDRYDRLITNLQFSFVSFNYMTEGRHYVWGSMADPLTAMLFVLGLGVTVFRVKRPAYRLLFTWWIVEVAFNGFSNPYPQPPISRMHAVVPPVAALAALGFDSVIRPFTDVSPYRRLVSDRDWRLAGGTLAIAALLPVVLYLNLYRFWYQLPRRFGPPSWEPVVLRAYREPQCEGKQVFIITRTEEQSRLFRSAFASYRIEPPPYLMSHSDAFEQLGDGLPEGMTGVGCVIVQSTNRMPEDPLVLEQVAHIFPEFEESKVTDLRGNSFAMLFAAP